MAISAVTQGVYRDLYQMGKAIYRDAYENHLSKLDEYKQILSGHIEFQKTSIVANLVKELNQQSKSPLKFSMIDSNYDFTHSDAINILRPLFVYIDNLVLSRSGAKELVTKTLQSIKQIMQSFIDNGLTTEAQEAIKTLIRNSHPTIINREAVIKALFD